jgi:nucleoid-associated protein YgaU
MAHRSYYDARRPAPRRRKRRVTLDDVLAIVQDMATGGTIGAVLFAVLAGVTLLSFYSYFQLSDRILVGVRAGDVRLGNLTAEEAAARLAAAWAADEQQVTLVDGERTWEVSPESLGLSLDASATAQRAVAVGHGQGFGSELAALAQGLLGGYPVDPVVALDAQAARAALEAQAEAVRIPPQDASIRFEGGEVIPIAGQPGRALDVETTLGTLTTSPSLAIRTGELPLATVPIAPRIADASGVAAEAEALLDEPLVIAAYDPILDESIDLTVPPETIATWLDVTAGESGLELTVSGERLASSIAELNTTLGPGRGVDAAGSGDELLAALHGGTPATLIVQHAPTTYAVQPGDTLTSIAWEVGMPYWRIAEANPGINPDALTAGQTLTIPSKNDLLPLPVVPGKRIVVSISEQRLRAYENGQLVNEFVISTGIDRSPTQPGVFQVQTHELNAYASIWDLWMPHFLGIYEAWPGFMNGFHGLPTLSSGGVLWADVLGSPASYGCIILDLEPAEWLYNWAEAGVVVEIRE